MKTLLAIGCLFASVPAFAADNVALTSFVFVEKTVAAVGQKPKVVLAEPKVVLPGDKLVFILNYRNLGSAPARNFVVTNPMPGAVAFQGTNDQQAIVSVDGGRNWGRLSELRLREKDGSARSARAEDVTHVRWTLKQDVPAGAQGKLSFRGIVR